MSATYILTKLAAADLREIVRYTYKQWGRDQALAYTDRLQRGIEQLAAQSSSVGKDLSVVADLETRLVDFKSNAKLGLFDGVDEKAR